MRESFIIQLAGQYFEIFPRYDYVREYCREYVMSGNDGQKMNDDKGKKHAIPITIEKEDILFERKKSEAEDKKEGRPIRHFSDEYLETLAVYRKIAEVLVDYDTILFHGSVVAVDGKGYLFTAKSGTGKSTHVKLWRTYFGNRAVMVNDDKPLLKITEQEVIAYGTPWDGKHRLSSNIAVPLKGIAILHQAKENEIKLADKREIYPKIIQQTNRSSMPIHMVHTLDLLDRLMKNVPIYELGCNMEVEAAKVAFEEMRE